MLIDASFIRICLTAARQAGEIIKKNWNSPHAVRHKGAIDLVTETDLAVQEFLRASLSALLPQAAFVGEETDIPGQRPDPDKGLCWIVDPVDGTTNFVHRIPFVGTSIALCENGRPILGIVNAPMLGECFHAVKDGGAFLNDEPINASTVDALTDALACTGFPYEVKPQLPVLMDRLERVLPATQGLRRLGAASVDLAYVACGRLDVFYEDGLRPWDMAAGWLLVERAGGLATHFDGSTLRFNGSVLATNGLVHDAMVAALTGNVS